MKKYAKIEADTIENCENNDIINRKDLLRSLHQESKCIVCTLTSLFYKRQQQFHAICQCVNCKYHTERIEKKGTICIFDRLNTVSLFSVADVL